MQWKSWSVLMLAALFAAGCGGASSSSPPKDNKPKPTDDSKPKDGTGSQLGKPEFTVSATDLVADYKKGPDAAEAKYGNKVLEVTGKVVRIDLGLSNNTIYLEGDPGKDEGTVSCWTDEPRPWTKVLPGQTVKIKGVSNTLKEPILKKSEIGEVSGAPPKTMTADELGREVAKNRTAVRDANKYLVVTGEIDKVESPGVTNLYFKAKEGTPRVVVEFAGHAEKAVKALQAGQQIKVLADWGFGGKADEVKLWRGILIEPAK